MTMNRRSFVRLERRLIRTVTPSWRASRICAYRQRSRPPGIARPLAGDPRPARPTMTRAEVLQAANELALAQPTRKILNRDVAKHLGVPMSTIGLLAADLRRAGLWPHPGFRSDAPKRKYG